MDNKRLTMMTSKFTWRATALACVLAMVPVTASAKIYVYRGPSGETTFANKPMGHGYKLQYTIDDGVSSSSNNTNFATNKARSSSDVPRLTAIGAANYRGRTSTGSGSAARYRNSNEYDHYIREVAYRHSVSPALVKAVIQVESNFNPDAVSRAGARGLMQLMPGTAAMYKVGMDNIFDPHYNIDAGVRHLAYLKGLFPNNIDYVLAAYNAGENNVIKYNGIPPFPETINYVDKVKTSLARTDL